MKGKGLSLKTHSSSKNVTSKLGKAKGIPVAKPSSKRSDADELLRRTADNGVSLASLQETIPGPAAEVEAETNRTLFEEDFLPLNAGDDDAVVPATGKPAGRNVQHLGTGSAAGAEQAGGPGTSKAPNVLYIARIPHGFYEDQMAGFLGQFGTITRLRISRNKKTGKSKHYAFVEFESPEVARIVAECMHNYLLFGSIVQCRLVPPEKLHPLTWIGANRRFRKVPWRRRAREAQNRVRSPEEEQRHLRNQVLRERKRRAKLAAAGIDYEFKGLESFRVLTDVPSHIKFDD